MSRWYGNVVAVNDVSFALGPGVTGLLGPNGAGKSTLLHLMSGFLRPSAGEVMVAGGPAWHRPALYRQVGLVPEREAVYPFLTGFEFARFNARLQGLPDPDAAAARAIELVDLGSAQHRPIGTYSKGMRQRAKVAGALVHDPPILLLDEPFNGMDPRQRLSMMELLRTMAAEGRDGPVLLAHPRGGGAARRARPGHRRRAARRFGRLPGDPQAHDRPAAHVHGGLERRPAAGGGPARQPAVFGVELAGGSLTVRTSDFAAFSRAIAGASRAAGIRLFELLPTDESLESVFSYLVER